MAAFLSLSRRSYFGLLFDGFVQDSSSAELSYGLYVAFSAAGVLVGILAAKRGGMGRLRLPSTIALAVFVSASPLVVWASGLAGQFSEGISVVGIAVLSGGTTVLAFSLTSIFVAKRYSWRLVGVVLSAAFLISALLSLCPSLLLPAGRAVYVCVCPLLVAVAWVGCVRLSDAESSLGKRTEGGAAAPSPEGLAPDGLHGSRGVVESGRMKARRDRASGSGGVVAVVDAVFAVAMFLVCSVMLGCSFTESLSFETSTVYLGTHLVLVLVCVMFMVVLAVWPGNFALNVFEVLGVLAFIVLFFFAALFDAGWVDRGANIVASTRLCFELFMWVALIGYASCRAARSAWPVATVFLVRLLSDCLINLALPHMKASFGDGVVSAVYTVFLAAFFLFSIAFLVYKIARMGWTPTGQRQVAREENAVAPEPEGRDAFARTCEVLARRYDLSAREREVMELVARGNSARWIAESLCVSTSTVQTHSKSIYRKLGIHSKQELIQLVNGHVEKGSTQEGAAK